MAYSTRRRLGRGGMGVVDLAVDADGRPVALKRLALHGSAEEMARARLRVRREVEALRSVDHPAIVELLEVVDDGDDLVLVMPFLGGGTLADRVSNHGPLPPAQVHLLADTLLDALTAAHRAGIVHRDIKPANVLFDEVGRPYLTDFGVATMRDATSGLTGNEVVVGTPEYMAPEQARGERATTASDVFSLGATLRFAAVGTAPYGHGDPRVILHRASEGKIERLPSEMPRDLRRRLEPLLLRKPERRPSAAAARGAAGATRILSRRRAPRTAVGTRLWPAALGAAVVAALAVAGSVAVVARRPDMGAAQSDSPTTTTAAPCTGLPYQPCGAPAAPFTDGRACTDGHADYDTVASNGCEAAPDAVDGTALGSRPIAANLVPSDDVDRYPFHLTDHFQLLCDGTARVSLTAPAGVSMRLEVLHGSTTLGSAISDQGQTATVELADPDCLADDGTDLVARVSWVGTARSASPYRLARSGSY